MEKFVVVAACEGVVFAPKAIGWWRVVAVAAAVKEEANSCDYRGGFLGSLAVSQIPLDRIAQANVKRC